MKYKKKFGLGPRTLNPNLNPPSLSLWTLPIPHDDIHISRKINTT